VTPEVEASLAARGQPATTFHAVQLAMAQALGHRLFTIMRHDGRFSRRVHSSMPDAYPEGGIKAQRDIHWMHRLREGQPCVINGEGQFREVFTDHSILLGLGGSTALKLPVLWNGRLLGVVNLVDGPRGYDGADALLAMRFVPFVIPGLLG
jgi:hypothetical protein